MFTVKVCCKEIIYVRNILHRLSLLLTLREPCVQLENQGKADLAEQSSASGYPAATETFNKNQSLTQLIHTTGISQAHHTGWSKKMAQSLRHHKFATVHYRIIMFSAKCSNRNSLHD